MFNEITQVKPFRPSVNKIAPQNEKLVFLFF